MCGPAANLSRRLTISTSAAPSVRARRDAQTLDLMALDEVGDEARRFCLLDESAEEGRAGHILARRAYRLLHRGEFALDDARSGDLLHVGEKARSEACQSLELVAGELLEGAVQRVGAHERSVLDVAVEPEPVSR